LTSRETSAILNKDNILPQLSIPHQVYPFEGRGENQGLFLGKKGDIT
jgi:hypothetical protein